jgi:hypothetical protein
MRFNHLGVPSIFSTAMVYRFPKCDETTQDGQGLHNVEDLEISKVTNDGARTKGALTHGS